MIMGVDTLVDVPCDTVKVYRSHLLAVVVCTGAVPPFHKMIPAGDEAHVTVLAADALLHTGIRSACPGIALESVTVTADAPICRSCWVDDARLSDIAVVVAGFISGLRIPPLATTNPSDGVEEPIPMFVMPAALVKKVRSGIVEVANVDGEDVPI